MAQTFLTNPDIIILDEPFSGLDPVNAQILKDIINEFINKDRLLIFSSHQMNYVEEFCEDIALIDKGTIVLTGNLNKIKREYGKNRLTVSSLSLSLEQLKRLIEDEMNNIVKEVEMKKEYLIIELQEDYTKNDFLRAAVDKNIDIKKFSIYEPGLEDIFVKKVGEK